MLAEVLNVGAPLSETSEAYQPMFFSSPQVFHELYSVTVQLLNKTWKEMRATSGDFNRVGLSFIFVLLFYFIFILALFWSCFRCVSTFGTRCGEFLSGALLSHTHTNSMVCCCPTVSRCVFMCFHSQKRPRMLMPTVQFCFGTFLIKYYLTFFLFAGYQCG